MKTSNMKYAVVLLLVISSSLLSKNKSESYGVGFNFYQVYDTTQLYVYNQDTIFRPLLIHLWYPTELKTDNDQMSYKQYIDLISIREDFSKPKEETDTESLNFINAYSGFAKKQYGIGLNLSAEQILATPVKARLKSPIAKGNFPLIIYAPSNSKTSEQNHIICESLASSGFVVLSVASAGQNSINREDTKSSILAQVNDMEYILNYLENTLKIQYSNIGLMGFSSGGLATSIFQMKHENVKAVFGLDGGHEYSTYLFLHQLKDYDLSKTTVPYCFMANKNLDFSIYPYFNSIKTNKKWFFRMPYLTHNDFASYWAFFDSCNKDSVQNNISISYKYISDYAVTFFDATLNNNLNSKKALDSLSSLKNEFVIPEKVDYSQATNLLNTYLGSNIDSAISIYKKDKSKKESAYNYSESEINILGKMLYDKYLDDSIKLFYFNTEEYPNSWLTHFYLGYAYKAKGNLGLAKISLLKAQELNPEEEETKKLLSELEK